MAPEKWLTPILAMTEALPERSICNVGKTAVRFNIPEAEAVERLVDLIKEHGKWTEPQLETTATGCMDACLPFRIVAIAPADRALAPAHRGLSSLGHPTEVLCNKRTQNRSESCRSSADAATWRNSCHSTSSIR